MVIFRAVFRENGELPMEQTQAVDSGITKPKPPQLERFVRAGEPPYLRYELEWRILTPVLFIAILIAGLARVSGREGYDQAVASIITVLLLGILVGVQRWYFRSHRRWRKEVEERRQELAKTWQPHLRLTSLSTSYHVVFPQSEGLTFRALREELIAKGGKWDLAIRQPGRTDEFPGLAFGLRLDPSQVVRGFTQPEWAVQVYDVSYSAGYGRGSTTLNLSLDVEKLGAVIYGPWPEEEEEL